MVHVHVHYHLKNLLLRFSLAGYGHYRRFLKMKDPAAAQALEQHPLRKKHHDAEGWQAARNDDIRYRNYASYNEYLAHQKLKWNALLWIQGGIPPKYLREYRHKFYSRFRILPSLLPPQAQMVCAGARQGTEVEVLRDLGFANAMGIDLNPGPDNPFVKVGDFMHMDQADDSVDFIYTNCVDHAFNLEGFFAEHARVLRPDGFVMYDLARHQEGGPFEAVEWKSEQTVLRLMLGYFDEIIEVHSEPQWKWMLLKGKHLRR